MITRKEIQIKAKRYQFGRSQSYSMSIHDPAMNKINKNRKQPSPMETLLSLANLSLIEKDTFKAQNYYKKALRLAKDSNAPALAVQPLLGLSSIALSQNDDNQARSYYRIALQIANGGMCEDIQKDVQEFNLH